MKNAFWKTDWFLGLVIAIALLGLARTSGFIPGLERWAYDLGVKMTSKSPSERIAVIAIDEQSIANIGRWPWPREVQAKLIDKLAEAKAKVIGNTTFFFEPQKDPGLAYVEKMLGLYGKAYPAGSPEIAEVGEIGKLLNEASIALNSDVRLAASIQKAGNVLVPLAFGEIAFSPPPGRPDKPLPEYVARNTIASFTSAGGNFLRGSGALVPIEQIGSTVAGMGHLNTSPDEDGAIRFEPLVIDYYGQVFPSLSLIARREEPQPHLQGREGETGRERHRRRQAHPHRRPRRRCTRTSTRIATGGPPSRSTRSSTCTRARSPRPSTPTRSSSSARPPRAWARAR